MPCLAKLFNSILNPRLQKFLDTNETINHRQIGFQPKARTVDHMFILRTLIENIQITDQNCMFVLLIFKRHLTLSYILPGYIN